MTDNEAALLNEINGVHSDYHFGYDQFTPKDVVVEFNDAVQVRSFLDTSREIFELGLAYYSQNRFDLGLGFVCISGSLIVPYITKPAASNETHGGVHSLKRFVPKGLVSQKVAVTTKVETRESDEWDLSYVKMLMIYAGFDHSMLSADEEMCALSDLKWDMSLCPLSIEEYTPPMAQTKQHLSLSKPVKREYGMPSSHASSNSPYNIPAAHSSMSHSGHSIHNQSHHIRNSNTPSHHLPQAHLNPHVMEDPWLRSTAASSPNTTLRSLHQVTHVVIHGVTLKAINLKAYAQETAVLLSEVRRRFFPRVDDLAIHYFLEKVLQVKLYEYTPYVSFGLVDFY